MSNFAIERINSKASKLIVGCLSLKLLSLAFVSPNPTRFEDLQGKETDEAIKKDLMLHLLKNKPYQWEYQSTVKEHKSLV